MSTLERCVYCRGAKYVEEQSLRKTMFIGWWSETAGGVNGELRCQCTASDVGKARTEALLQTAANNASMGTAVASAALSSSLPRSNSVLS